MALGTTEILIIVGCAMLLFGAPKIVDWAKSLGKAQREYHRAKDGAYDPVNTASTADKTVGNDPKPKSG